ncbi:uncharacterized protein LOC130899276 [Diorhabda carinulata]|uniref:uncharacterized protein LOC130899276 n=1 Tax=Diorhabda carinulata TaxID=1163345 RepID=UPI0025A02BAE|nr:uncharacterized protein LOC130899276 [Diorhabda carinulata]
MAEKNSSEKSTEEYSWALKGNLLLSEVNEKWTEKKKQLTHAHVRTRFESKTIQIDENHVRIMASLVPDEIIYNIGDYSKRDMDACLLFGDVSGFTDLCEKYNKSGKGGPSRLTQVLNSYIGAMVQEILSHSGDVLKFSGDAFIAMWKETDHLSLRDAIHETLDCALVIQKTYGTYQTDVDVVVRVKLAVACGHLMFSLLGDDGNSHYLMIGQPIDDIKAAESKSSAGEIVISARVLHHTSANEYLIDLLPDGIHAKVLGVGPNWRNIQRHYEKTELVEIYSILSIPQEDGFEEGERFTNLSDKSSIEEDDTSVTVKLVNDQYALRPAVNHAVRINIMHELRRFIIAPVMNGIDAEEPIEYLTEIRQVCILFINIKVNDKLSPSEGIDTASKIYLTVCNTVKYKNGCVNKISNFDKDLMLLAIFGLRGFKHELESQLALKCAIECYNSLTSLPNVRGVAAGVTTGKTYCGAFGHTLRREYTVIGLVVNKAARLMVAYPDKVTCDRETFLHSKLESRNFILQDYKPLKGIANPGPIYEFKGVQTFHTASHVENPYPLLGREQEIDLYWTMLQMTKKAYEHGKTDRIINTLIYQGVFRQGKTRLLDEIMHITSKYFPVIKITISAFTMEVFRKYSVIIIDDGQYIDEESCLLLNLLINENMVFVVATMDTETYLSALTIQVLRNSKIKIVELKAIDKWYHVGLACQMLNVDGIAAELEKTIQQKSNGNPGWIESFLVSLLQSGGLLIRKIKRINAYNLGIVIPPLYMTMRLSKEEMNLWVEIMEERKLTVEDKMTTRWKMFIDSCRESYPDLTVGKVFHKMVKKNDKIVIGTVNKSFNLEDVDAELAIDVIILKIFDGLTSYEQLLLKCSAVLGDTFPRDMLLYIMSSSAIQTTALAVQKLFEIHVLSCAKGDFIEGGLDFEKRLENPNKDMEVSCECKGLLIDESCRNLPKYASCGYLRFRSSEFRETTYNLLTDNQKREFHERAIRYLEKETRRCRACGNGYFVRQIGGTRVDNTIRIYSKKDRKSVLPDIASLMDNYGASKILQSSSLVSMDSITSKKSKDFQRSQKDTLSVFSSLSSGRDFFSFANSSRGNEMGLTMIRKLKDNFYLMRTFSTINYSQCTCHLVLTTMYSQMIDHCKGAGLAEKILNVTVEYAYICIDNMNIPQAIRVLEEGLQLLEGPMKDQIELDWMIDLRKGKLYALLGYARMQIDDDEAYTYFMEALKYYSVTYPKTRGGKKILRAIFKLKQHLKYYLGRTRVFKKTDDDFAEYNNDVSECFYFLCKYFTKKRRWQEAELTAMWSLSKALKTETDFEKLCLAYGNLIFIQSTLGNEKFCIYLEVFALKLCHRKKTHIEMDELKALAYLYYTIYRDRLRRAEIDKCLQIGYVEWRLAAASRSENLLFLTLPILAFIVLNRRQLPEFVNLLEEVKALINRDTDNSEKSWYFDLCLMVHIETGLSAEPFSNILKYMNEEGWDPIIRDPIGKQQLIVLIWLWEIRNENWESAVGWQEAAWKIQFDPQIENTLHLITGLYLLEGLIIYLSYKMDRKHLQAVTRATNRINGLFSSLEKFQKKFKMILPRLYHMKGYFRIVKYNDYKGAMRYLKIGKKYAETCFNDLEIGYIRHSELAWLKKLSKEDAEFWKEHAYEDNLIDVRDMDYIDKFVQYTLPVPIYV